MSVVAGCDIEQVTGLVDGELPPDAARAVEDHLAACASCRELAEAERAVRARLRGLPRPELPPGFETRLRARLSAAARPRSRPLWVGLPVAATLVLLLWTRGLAPFVAWEVARDHGHCFGRPSLPTQVRSADPAVVADWFVGRGTSVPSLPATLGEARLYGGRYCRLIDVSSVPHLYYTGAARPLSVFLLAHEARFEDGYTASSGGRSVALLRLAGRPVAVVGESPEDVDRAVSHLRSGMLTAELLSAATR